MSDPDVARTLDDLVAYNRRYVVLNERQLVAVALWEFHTYVVHLADSTAYLSITSALPRSGKTRLLEVMELLVHQPMPTANISDAALFRAIAKLKPTLLFDEIDSVFGDKARDREDLRGMINAGYRRGALCYRMGGANNRVLEAFDVFCAKAFAGIGELPQTIRDRSIRIRLERRIQGEEPVERFRRRDAEPDAHTIQQSIVNLAEHHAGRLFDARPKLPDKLDDRAQDIWEPLLAIAELAGDDWAKKARKAAVALSGDAEREDDSNSVQLLRDLHTVFSSNGAERYRTADLIDQLAQIEESPWGDWYGKPISSQKLSSLLRPYRIRTMPVWVDEKTVKGYKAEQFDEVWLRVLGVRRVRGVRNGSSTGAEPNPPNPPNPTHASNGDQPDFPESGEWLARDGQWRRYDTDPPALTGEVIGTRNAGEQPANERSTT